MPKLTHKEILDVYNQTKHLIHKPDRYNEYKKIAKQYNVSGSTIRSIAVGTSHKKVTNAKTAVMEYRKRLPKHVVLEIYNLKGKEKTGEVAKQYNISYATVRKIWRGATHSNITKQSKYTTQKQSRLSKETIEKIMGFKGKKSGAEVCSILNMPISTIYYIWKRGELKEAANPVNKQLKKEEPIQQVSTQPTQHNEINSRVKFWQFKHKFAIRQKQYLERRIDAMVYVLIKHAINRQDDDLLQWISNTSTLSELPPQEIKPEDATFTDFHEELIQKEEPSKKEVGEQPAEQSIGGLRVAQIENNCVVIIHNNAAEAARASNKFDEKSIKKFARQCVGYRYINDSAYVPNLINNSQKRIAKVDKDTGIILAIYQSISCALDDLRAVYPKAVASGISSCANRITNTAYNYKWVRVSNGVVFDYKNQLARFSNNNDNKK